MTDPRLDLAPHPAEDVTAYDGSRPLPEIEEDIARTRVRLSAAIDALERELAPARVVEQSTEVLRSALEPGPGSLRQQAWAYAIPLALIATGLGWLVMLRRRNWQAAVPPTAGDMPAEAVEIGDTPVPAPACADVAGPVEPMSLVDEKSVM
jgi:hypothetical protein